MEFTEKARPSPHGDGNVVDRMIEFVAPRIGLKRRAAREQLAASDYYRAAAKSRVFDDWVAGGESADVMVLQNLPTLRERSRELIRSDALAASITSAMVRNVVGRGIRPQSRINADALGLTADQAVEFQNATDTIFTRWQNWADSANRLDFYGMQRLAWRKRIEDGEIFGNIIMVREPSRPYETAVELIEADRVATPSGIDNAKVRGGIVLGTRGQPVSYWIRKSHPGDGLLDANRGQKKFSRKQAWDGNGRRKIIHLYSPDRPAQSRGVPKLTPVLGKIYQLGRYLEAEEIAKRIESCFGIVIKKNVIGPWTQGGSTLNSNNEREFEFQPGFIEELQPNEDIEFVDPKRPGAMFEPYVKQAIRTIGAGVELPLEVVLLDFSQTSWSSARTAILESRRAWKTDQDILVDRFCQPIWEALLEEAFLKGELPHVRDFYAERDLWCAADWLPDGWVWVDPVKDATASQMSIEMGVSNLAVECAKQGRDWREVVQTQALIEKETAEIREKLGLGSVEQPDEVFNG